MIEESTLAHLSDEIDRASIYAWYNIAARAGTALGMVVAGWAMTLFHEQKHVALLTCYRGVFVAYAVVGLVKFILCCTMSQKCEIEEEEEEEQEPNEASALLSQTEDDNKPTPAGQTLVKSDQKGWSMLPSLSSENTSLFVKLCILYAIDYVANGMASMSWIAYYLRSIFGLSEGAVGTVFLVVGILAFATGLLSASLARRIGNAHTMFYGMVPSEIAQIFMGLTYNLPIVLISTIVKLGTHSMDSAPNSAFLAAAFDAKDRTAIMGIVNIVKTLASSVGPTITGFMVENQLFWLVFVTSGLMKLGFDVMRFLLLRIHPSEIRAREERERQRTVAQE